MSDDNMIPDRDYYEDDRGLCDRMPYLQNGRYFTIVLKETFDVFTVRNDDKYFSVIMHDL